MGGWEVNNLEICAIHTGEFIIGMIVKTVLVILVPLGR